MPVSNAETVRTHTGYEANRHTHRTTVKRTQRNVFVKGSERTLVELATKSSPVHRFVVFFFCCAWGCGFIVFVVRCLVACSRLAAYDKLLVYTRLLQNFINRLHSPEPRTPTRTSEDLPSYRPTPKSLKTWLFVVTLYRSRPRSRSANRSAAVAVTDGRRVFSTLRLSRHYP